MLNCCSNLKHTFTTMSLYLMYDLSIVNTSLSAKSSMLICSVSLKVITLQWVNANLTECSFSWGNPSFSTKILTIASVYVMVPLKSSPFIFEHSTLITSLIPLWGLGVMNRDLLPIWRGASATFRSLAWTASLVKSS